MQESLTPGSAEPDYRTAFSEVDLALVDALQSSPRATWSQLGRVLGIDATTVARHWERLHTLGLAWITAYEAPHAATVAYVEVRCRPGSFEQVSRTLARMPWIFSVDETADDFDLFLSVAAPDLHSLGTAVHGTIGGLPGVHSTRTRLGITVFGEGSDWRTRAIDSAARAQLPESRTTVRDTYSSHMRTRLTQQDHDLRAALGLDGRLSYKALGEAAGLSEHTARRRLLQMLRDRDLTLRCDIAHPLAGYRAMVIYRARVPHQHLEQTGIGLAHMEQVRLAVSVSGPRNLLLMAWLHDLNGIGPFENLLADRFPHLEVEDRTVALHSPKRMGRLLDRHGRATQHIPLPPNL
ncbi:Lrp/AsnC family transcriptional regulator [Streptomyces uncialis]|uniref:Lrp/AsnC family transcriptional regulator n=1 Tax=Streptomyces uncialis TaxID=1048205 RepID=UPI002E359C1C|nr:Lrp/AsnC family transcriptional regulator [Streptomyces uncialis]